jgi:transposase-like protein
LFIRQFIVYISRLGKLLNALILKMTVPTLFSIQSILTNEDECIKFLFEKDILYKPEACKLCNSKLYQDKKRFCCVNKKCRNSTSIFKDSFFSKNHVKCNQTIMIGYLWLCKSSYTTIQMLTGHSPNTVSDYMRFFRELVVDTLEDQSQKIGGEGIIVEVDESKFGRRKYHRGRRVNGVWVIGGIEKTERKRCFLVKVERRDENTIKRILETYVKKGSIVRTDCWKGYLNIEDLGVSHETVNHSEHFTDPKTGVHTNTIEGLWNGIKLQIAPRNRNKELIENHLLEFIWRKINKDTLWDSFVSALRNTAYYDYDDITL